MTFKFEEMLPVGEATDATGWYGEQTMWWTWVDLGQFGWGQVEMYGLLNG